MENVFQLSELRKMDLDKDQKKILGLIDSAPFKFFLKWILKSGDLIVNEKGIKLNGKEYSNALIGKQQQKQMTEHGIQELSIKKEQITVKMGNNGLFKIILD